MLNNQTNSELRLLIVGDYLFEPKVGLLSGPSGAHHICPSMAALLSYLVEHSNEVVDRDYLISEIWPDCPHASQSLTRCIGRLRQYFDDVVPALNLPEWVNRLVVVLGLLGFPIAASLSWIFNLTPAGVVREPKNVSNLGSTSSRSWTDLALDSSMISVALFICGMLVFSVWIE